MDCERTMEPVVPPPKPKAGDLLTPRLREALDAFIAGDASAVDIPLAREAARILREAEAETAQRLSSLRRTAPR